MAIKKSELYSSIWASCDELRGGMDASQYKDYVLVLLFVKYVSDRAASDRGYALHVPKGASFKDLVALKGQPDIGDRMNKIIAKLAAANELTGVINLADWNDETKLGKGKEMVDRLSNLIAIFDKPGLDFRKNGTEGDDLLGDAYEYLMRHFATQSGKSKGQFYTPAEVSRVMAKVVGAGNASSNTQTIYDPTCGSGSLLLKAHDEAMHSGFDLAIYGQEIDVATTALAKMNVILHGAETAVIENGNTLSSPQFIDRGRLKTFDFVVANPPFSMKAWSNGLTPSNDAYDRFQYGIPPEKNGDYAFLLHILASLKSTGKAAVILPHGVLFRGNAEADIRRQIVQRGYVKGIIGLPPNLFYGTGIPACIVVLDKENAQARKAIFMIDASKGFLKDGAKNRLREQDIHKIVDVFENFTELPRYSRMVPLSEIENNDYNLNLPRYIDSSEPEDIQDIGGHLQGGIPQGDVDALDLYWQVFPNLRKKLFKRSRAGYCELRIEPTGIKETILGDEEFEAFAASVRKLFSKWRRAHIGRLREIGHGDKPKELIHALSEELLDTFEKAPLLDPYDVYQHLMTYWNETMQDDVYLLVSVPCWTEAAKPREIVPTKDKNGRIAWPEAHDFELGKRRYKSNLVPFDLLVARHCKKERAAVEEAEAELSRIAQELEELSNEHGGDEGLLADVVNEKGKVVAKDVRDRLKDIGMAKDFVDERALLQQCATLFGREQAMKTALKKAKETLAMRAATKYGELTDDDVRTLVIEDKWLATLEKAVESEIETVSQRMTGRVRDLAERYARPLPDLDAEVADLTARVATHLEKMGATWQ